MMIFLVLLDWFRLFILEMVRFFIILRLNQVMDIEKNACHACPMYTCNISKKKKTWIINQFNLGRFTMMCS